MNVMQEKASPYLKIYIQFNTCTCVYLQILISESRRIVSNVIKKKLYISVGVRYIRGLSTVHFAARRLNGGVALG